jgi:HD superfamily phosphohydrolase
MRVTDELYGSYQVEPVIEELLQTPAVIRLQDVHMAGPVYLLKPEWNETRYEHSVGVMLIIKRLGGSLAEQIAGLLHDVSHTAYSHVVDQALRYKGDDYHETKKRQVIEVSSIPDILSKYGFDVEELLYDDAQWSILEQPAPLLCADRIDYTLREVYRYFGTPLSEVHAFMDGISIVDGKMTLNDVKLGEWFTDKYYQVVIDFFLDELNVFSYDRFAKIINSALTSGVISNDQLFLNDSEFLAMLKTSGDTELQLLIQDFFAAHTLSVVTGEQVWDIHDVKKMRLIDPPIMSDSEVVTTSSLSPYAGELTQAARSKSERGVYLKID